MYFTQKIDRKPTHDELIALCRSPFEHNDSVFKWEIIADIIQNDNYFAAIKKTHIASGRERVYGGFAKIVLRSAPYPKTDYEVSIEAFDEYDIKKDEYVGGELMLSAPDCPPCIRKRFTQISASSALAWRRKSEMAYKKYESYYDTICALPYTPKENDWFISTVFERRIPPEKSPSLTRVLDAEYTSRDGCVTRMVLSDKFSSGCYAYPKRLAGVTDISKWNDREKELARWLYEYGEFQGLRR